METSKQCCCIIGDVFVDVQANDVNRLPEWNSDTQASSIEVLPGGSAANTARQLHALLSLSDKDCCNAEVKFISVIGNDYFGQFFKDVCMKEGLNFHLKELNRPTSVCMCLSGASDRAFVSCYSSTDAIEVGHFLEQIPANTIFLHIGGFFNLVGLHSKEFLKFCKMLKSKGIALSLSTQYDAREKWTGENNILEDLFPLCNLVFVNENELQNLLPVLAGNTNVTVVETKGSKGCTIHTKSVQDVEDFEQHLHDVAIDVPIDEKVEIVDATGAGDAFIAGFIEEWMKVSGNITIENLISCCKRGHQIAGLNVQRVGACSKPVIPKDLIFS